MSNFNAYLYLIVAVIMLGTRSVKPSALFAKLFDVTPRKTAKPKNKYEVARLILRL